MASFYSSVSSEGDLIPTAYLLNQKLPYPSSDLSNNKDYEIQHSNYLSYPNLLSGNNNLVDSASITRDEMVFISPNNVSAQMHQIDRQMSMMPRYSDGNSVISDTHMFSKESMQVHSSEQMQDYHGLSVSLGSQGPSMIQLSSDMSQYSDPSFSSVLSSNMPSDSQGNDLKNVQYLSFDLTDENYGSGSNLMGSKMTSFVPSMHQAHELSGTFCSSKYLKAAQDLLVEIVNIHKVVGDSENIWNLNSINQDVKKDESSAEFQEASAEELRDLSPSERHDLQNKISKLFSMLDEVDRRYKQYVHQKQTVVSSCDMVVGHGAAQPYTTVIPRAVSRQFRRLRDAIKKQIEEAQKRLGEQDASSQGVLSRLRFVDQQLSQKKALHQFGVMRQPWRPQRGLPENAVSVLRAWLFEHFLHPYPKDSEKTVLARQTGLSRSQVANWFINARVRLWKPMIEEMYKEEFGDAEIEPKSSPENASTAQDLSAFDERRNEFLRNLTRPDVTEMDASRTELSFDTGSFQDSEDNFGLSFDTGSFQDSEDNFGLTHFPNKQVLNASGNSVFF